MIAPVSAREKLLYTTVRIECWDAAGTPRTGKHRL
jgi:hypothetical protein